MIDRILKKKKFFFIIFFAFLTTLYAPLKIFYNNYEILVFNFETFQFVLTIGIFSFLILIIFCNFFFKSYKFFFFLNTLLILILIFSKIFDSDYSYKLLIFVDLFILTISYLISRDIKKIYIIFYICLFITLFSNFIFNSLKTYKNTQNLFVTKNKIKTFDKKGLKNNNVYHIVLDAFQYDIFVKLKDKKLIDLPKEFLIYENFFSEFQSTNLSMNYLMQQYEKSKLDYNQSKLLKKIYNKNINIFLYTKNEPQLNYATLHRNTYDYKGVENKTKNYFSTIYLLIDYAFLNLTPLTIKKYLEKYKFSPKVGLYGFSFTNWLKLTYHRFIPQDQSIVNINPKLTDWPYWSVKVFEELLRDERQRSNHNNYIFSHLIIPHGPFVLNEKGEFYNPDKSLNVMEKYEKQAIYSIKLMNNFFNLLKDQNKFDDSTIIIHSDHGHFFSKSEIINDSYKREFSEDNYGPFSKNNYGPIPFNKIEDVDDYINSWGKGILLIKPSQVDLNKYDIKEFHQLRHIRQIIERQFSIKSDNSSTDKIIHFISNNESDVKNYNIFHFDKIKKKWNFFKNIESDEINFDNLNNQ